LSKSKTTLFIGNNGEIIKIAIAKRPWFGHHRVPFAISGARALTSVCSFLFGNAGSNVLKCRKKGIRPYPARRPPKFQPLENEWTAMIFQFLEETLRVYLDISYSIIRKLVNSIELMKLEKAEEKIEEL
jgi:hypothetical protein